MKINQEKFELLRMLNKKPSASQRELASNLEISVGKLNYILNELKEKGLVKIKNFKKHENKSQYLYLLTPKGITEKTQLTINFMKRKLQEYDELKKEVENTKEKKDVDSNFSK
jgi:EPS-associated MarR family transcriptional regulator